MVAALKKMKKTIPESAVEVLLFGVSKPEKSVSVRMFGFDLHG